MLRYSAIPLLSILISGCSLFSVKSTEYPFHFLLGEQVLLESVILCRINHGVNFHLPNVKMSTGRHCIQSEKIGELSSGNRIQIDQVKVNTRFALFVVQEILLLGTYHDEGVDKVFYFQAGISILSDQNNEFLLSNAPPWQLPKPWREL